VNESAIEGPETEPPEDHLKAWNPTKIPRIQNSLSEGGSLVAMGAASLSQVKVLIGRTTKVCKVQLDESNGSHNPKVGGSNPPPATKESAGQGRFFGTGPSVSLAR
jgi:hypothetical protein